MKKTFLWVFIVMLVSFVLMSCEDKNPNEQGGGDKPTVDSTKPVVSMSVGSIAYVNDEISISYEVSDNVTAKEKIATELSFSNGSEVVEINGNSFTPTKSGNYEVTLKATDEAGNVETVSKIINVFNLDDELTKTKNAWRLLVYRRSITAFDCLTPQVLSLFANEVFEKLVAVQANEHA